VGQWALALGSKVAAAAIGETFSMQAACRSVRSKASISARNALAFNPPSIAKHWCCPDEWTEAAAVHSDQWEDEAWWEKTPFSLLLDSKRWPDNHFGRTRSEVTKSTARGCHRSLLLKLSSEGSPDFANCQTASIGCCSP
jgi:hypothetical protein